MQDLSNPPTETHGEPMPAASRMLEMLARAEPNDPASPDGTLADVFDHQLSPGLREWAGALEFAASKIVRHDGDVASGVSSQLERLACLIEQASDAAATTAAVMRGQMRPFPWIPAGQEPTFDFAPDEHDTASGSEEPAEEAAAPTDSAGAETGAPAGAAPAPDRKPEPAAPTEPPADSSSATAEAADDQHPRDEPAAGDVAPGDDEDGRA
jgi:hypothetical protein